VICAVLGLDIENVRHHWLELWLILALWEISSGMVCWLWTGWRLLLPFSLHSEFCLWKIWWEEQDYLSLCSYLSLWFRCCFCCLFFPLFCLSFFPLLLYNTMLLLLLCLCAHWMQSWRADSLTATIFVSLFPHGGTMEQPSLEAKVVCAGEGDFFMSELMW